MCLPMAAEAYLESVGGVGLLGIRLTALNDFPTTSTDLC